MDEKCLHSVKFTVNTTLLSANACWEKVNSLIELINYF